MVCGEKVLALIISDDEAMKEIVTAVFEKNQTTLLHINEKEERSIG